MNRLIFIILFFPSLQTFPQGIAINSSGTSPDISAGLDISFTDKGFLTPRMTITQRNAIPTPATGLLIYQTDSASGFYFYNGAQWVQLNDTSNDNQTLTINGNDLSISNGNTITLPSGGGGSLPNYQSSTSSSWQSSNTSTAWEDVTILYDTIPTTGLYMILCNYQAQDGGAGTQQYQRIKSGTTLSETVQVGPWISGFQNYSITFMVEATAGDVVRLQNQNDWNNGYKDIVRNIKFILVKFY